MATRGQNLTFIEVGANDGTSSGDPIREFIVKYPWKGVLVEPQPDVFEALKANYAGFEDRISFENVAISNSPTPLELYRVPQDSKSKHKGSSIASFDHKITAKQAQTRPNDLDKITVPTARLDDIVARYGLTSFDVLQLDTEGYDFEVLQTLDLTKTRPWLIGFEHGHLSPAAIDSMTRHLNAHGYSVNFGGYHTDSAALRDDFISH